MSNGEFERHISFLVKCNNNLEDLVIRFRGFENARAFLRQEKRFKELRELEIMEDDLKLNDQENRNADDLSAQNKGPSVAEKLNPFTPTFLDLPGFIQNNVEQIKNNLTMIEKCECSAPCACFTKANRRKNIFTDRSFYAQKLITTNEDGSKNFDELIEHIKFVEEVLKDLKSIHQAFELVKINMMNSATAAEREKIREKDKEYQPKFQQREKDDRAKATEQEKKIRQIISLAEMLGKTISRSEAEKIVFSQAPKVNVPKESLTKEEKIAKSVASLGLDKNALNSLIYGKE